MSPPRRERGTAKQEDMIGVHELTMATIADNRRSQARGKMLQTHNQNMDLIQKNADLERENEELRETINSVTSLARTSLIRSDALIKTIDHLRKAWQEDAPASTVREEVDQGVETFFTEKYRENLSDPKVGDDVDAKITHAKNQAKITARSRRPR